MPPELESVVYTPALLLIVIVESCTHRFVAIIVRQVKWP
jgi:hypothetical protein